MKSLRILLLSITIITVFACGGKMGNESNSVIENDNIKSIKEIGDTKPRNANEGKIFEPLKAFSVEMKYDWQYPEKTKFTIFDNEPVDVYSIFPGDNYTTYQIENNRIWISLKDNTDILGNLRLYCIDTETGIIEDKKINVLYKILIDSLREIVIYNYAKQYTNIPGSPGYSPILQVVRIANLKTGDIIEYDKNLELPYLPTGIDLLLDDNILEISYYADSSVSFKEAQVDLTSMKFVWKK